MMNKLPDMHYLIRSSISLLFLINFTHFCKGASEILWNMRSGNPTSETQVYSIPGDTTQNIKKDPFFGVGVFIGADLASGYYDFTAMPPPSFPSLLIGPAAGLDFDFRFGQNFSIRSQIGYRQKGDKIDMAKWYAKIEEPEPLGEWLPVEIIADGSIETRIGYVDMSMVPVIHFSRYFCLGLGGYASIGLHGTEKTDYELSYLIEGGLFEMEEVKGQRLIGFSDFIGIPDDETTRYFNRLDYGLAAMIGFGRRPITIDLGVSYGLATWQPTETLFSSSISPNQTHHLVGTLSVTLWLR